MSVRLQVVAWLAGFAAFVLLMHAIPSHAEVVSPAPELASAIAPPVNLKPPTLCVKHQTYINAHGKTVTGCEPIAQFEAQGRTLTPAPFEAQGRTLTPAP
jgi:hypothetical protein